MKDYNAAVFLCPCSILFIIKMGLLICKYKSFWQEISVVSDTRVTVKACGPFVHKIVCDYKFMMNWKVILHGLYQINIRIFNIRTFK